MISQRVTTCFAWVTGGDDYRRFGDGLGDGLFAWVTGGDDYDGRNAKLSHARHVYIISLYHYVNTYLLSKFLVLAVILVTLLCMTACDGLLTKKHKSSYSSFSCDPCKTSRHHLHAEILLIRYSHTRVKNQGKGF
jgi:hypothetical protein